MGALLKSPAVQLLLAYSLLSIAVWVCVVVFEPFPQHRTSLYWLLGPTAFLVPLKILPATLSVAGYALASAPVLTVAYALRKASNIGGLFMLVLVAYWAMAGFVGLILLALSTA